jgi:hypothetical protein
MTKNAFGDDISFGQALTDAAIGGTFGVAADFVVPGVRGGWNFNPWKSEATFGAKATQAYAQSAWEQEFDWAKNLAKSMFGRKCPN